MITVFDAPGAGTGPSHGTYPFSPLIINPNGAIAGALRGFLRDKNGAITTFDATGAGMDPGQGPYPFSIAPNGAMTGYSNDANNLVHCFVVTE